MHDSCVTIVLLTSANFRIEAVSEENWKEGDAPAIHRSVFPCGLAEQPILFMKVMNQIYIFVCTYLEKKWFMRYFFVVCRVFQSNLSRIQRTRDFQRLCRYRPFYLKTMILSLISERPSGTFYFSS